MNLVSRSIMVPELFHFEHAQVHVIIAEDWLVFPNYFICTGIELCSANSFSLSSLNSLSVLCIPEK